MCCDPSWLCAVESSLGEGQTCALEPNPPSKHPWNMRSSFLPSLCLWQHLLLGSTPGSALDFVLSSPCPLTAAAFQACSPSSIQHQTATSQECACLLASVSASTKNYQHIQGVFPPLFPFSPFLTFSVHVRQVLHGPLAQCRDTYGFQISPEKMF